jgi:hypothetical protein
VGSCVLDGWISVPTREGGRTLFWLYVLIKNLALRIRISEEYWISW